PEVAHIRTLIEKPRGKQEIFHWHEHCADLGTDFQTAPVEVLWIAGRFNDVQAINIYEAVRSLVWRTLHDAIGMRIERATTYGVIEEWGDADLDRYATEGVPKLLDAGIKTIMVPNHFQNNMNTWGVSNMCCTVDYIFHDKAGMKRLADAVHAGGARFEMWGNTSISTLTLIFDKPDGAPKRIDFLPRAGSIMDRLGDSPWVRNASGAIEADHYTPVFAVLNLRDPQVRAYWHECWRAAREEVGLDVIFLDSSFNLSSDKFHYAYNPHSERAGGTIDQVELLTNVRPAQEPPAAIQSQYRAHLDLMADMQQYGYVYCGEDNGIFGISRSGPATTFRLDNLFMWMECLAVFDPAAIEAAGAEPADVFFKGLAYRMVWTVYWNIKYNTLSFAYCTDDDIIPVTEWHTALFKAFNQVNDLMIDREVLPGEVGVMYAAPEAGDSARVVWAFEDFDLPVESGAAITDVLTGETQDHRAHKYHVYLIR
ncbi:MAG: hypothetical protein GYB65_19370, partial [Chloroflexi bacterium]|nr:hypothetical protein [Chloroflexota bacterium]